MVVDLLYKYMLFYVQFCESELIDDRKSNYLLNKHNGSKPHDQIHLQV